MREKPWAVVPLLDEAEATQWFATRSEAEAAAGAGYDIQYRPGRKPKVQKSDPA